MLRWTLLPMMILATVTAAGQMNDTRYEDPNDDGARRSSFWLPRDIQNLMARRMADDMAERYGFDENQRYLTQELFEERFPEWFADNREQIEPLAHEWMRMFLGDEAPSPERIAEWAADAQPLFQEFTTVVEDTSHSMREYMTEDQQVMLDGELAAFRVATGVLNRRMEDWKHGGFDPQTDWHRSEGFREAEHERRRAVEAEMDAARAAAIQGRLSETGTPPIETRYADPDKPDMSDPWVRHVEEFIKKYDLNAEQSTTARQLLRKKIEERDNYLRRTNKRIAAVEEELLNAETSEDKERWSAEYRKLAAPIERAFRVLNERLDKLPTRAQRAAAQKKEQEQSPAETPAEQPAGEDASARR